MSPSPQLAPPGSSTYTSDTMHVGDGTWDAGRDNFLLPPLVGLNFNTMRYNGMGNRFFTLTGYHSVVKAHGVIAAITFLGLVPAAILIMRFGGRRPILARRLHIWLQILTLLLSTVIIILGAFAVGPTRALSNPHHGIGVAIYTLIWVQVIFGCVVYRRQKKRRTVHLTLRAMLHHWLGRAIALLGIAQVPLGLTLYGSPLSLFVLYTLWIFALIVTYFVLQWLHEKRRSQFQSQDGSYIEGTATRPEERRHGGFGKLAAAGAAGAGLATLFNRRRTSNNRPTNSEFTGTEDGTSYMYDEKDSAIAPRKSTGIGHRLLQIGAIGGGIAAARRIFGGRKDNSDDASDVGPYNRPPLGGNQSVTTADSMSRVEEGRPPRPMTPTALAQDQGRASHPLAQPPMTPGSSRVRYDDEYSEDSYMSASPSRQGRHQTFRQAVAAGGAVFAVRQLFKHRRQKKEERRADDLRRQRIEEERIQRMDSQRRYTGDGAPSRRSRQDRLHSQTASDFSSTIEGSVLPARASSALPAGAGAAAGLAATHALANRDRIRPVGDDPVIAPPGPASAVPSPANLLPSDVPPPPPPHGSDFQSSGSELYTTTSGRQRHRHHLDSDGAAVAAAGVGGAAVAAAEASRRRHSGRNTDSLESPPVSLKVKMHNDGRHVTLRRLTEEEAAAQREARRRDRRASAGQRRRTESMSSGSGGEGFASSNARWRRTEALEAQQAAENQAAAAAAASAGAQSISPMPGASTSGPIYPAPPPPGSQHQAVDPQTGLSYHIPMPPPIPASTSNLGPAGSITSPGTETSVPTDYATNRRRRRAERAQARQAREARQGGHTVEFE